MMLLPPLIIQLGLMKNLMKALEKKNGAVSQNLYTPFPALNSARIKGGHLRRSTGPRSAEECGTCEAVYRKSTESMERI